MALTSMASQDLFDVNTKMNSNTECMDTCMNMANQDLFDENTTMSGKRDSEINLNLNSAKRQKTQHDVGPFTGPTEASVRPYCIGGRFMFAEDLCANDGRKQYHALTWREAYDKVQLDIQNNECSNMYEHCYKDKKCVLYFDIDDKVEKEEDHCCKEYLDDFKEAVCDVLGIDGKMWVQNACGTKGDSYKVSYHITFPDVHFKSHIHLKQFLQSRGSQHDTNGKLVKKTMLFIGKFGIDMSVYRKGVWRMPWCTKKGSTRVLIPLCDTLDVKEMTLKAFTELSIHSVPGSSQLINVELKDQVQKSNRSRTNVSTGKCSIILNEVKDLYLDKAKQHGVAGEFKCNGLTNDSKGVIYEALGGSWTCAHGQVHESNRCFNAYKDRAFCNACGSATIYSNPVQYFSDGDGGDDRDDKTDGKEPFPWEKFMDRTDRMVQEKFMENHSKNFIINTDYKREETKLCYFDVKSCLWKHDPKAGIGKSVIHNLLMNDEFNYWDTEMEASIEGMDDHKIDDDGVQQPNKVKEACIKFKKRHLKQYNSTGGWLGGTIRNIYTMLLHNTNLRVEVQFNLMTNTKHLFQFSNGAYNFKTGKMEKRRRDMYISGDAVLKYPYPENETDEDYVEELKVIEDMLKKCLTNDEEREAWCSWKGYCLTGEINGQMSFIYLGAGAGNGKSIVGCEIFQNAFPCYVKLLGKDALNDKVKDDKSLSSLANKAYRMCYCEELKELGLKIKELTNQSTPVKPLYMEEILLIIQFKLEALCNKVPNTNCDEGMLRRMRQLEWLSKFVDTVAEVNEDDHIYLKDPDIADKFKFDDRYKIALFRYFSKYTRDYYERGVNDWKSQFEGMRQAFQDTNEDDDAMATFVNCFERDTDEDAIISKSEMLNHLHHETGEEFIKFDGGRMKYKNFTTLKNKFKGKRFKYNGSLRKSGQKGFFTGIKFAGTVDEDEDE